MEHKRINIIISAFLLCLLSACQMTGVTPAPQPPGAGIIQNNPGGPIQLAPTSTTPTAAPTASSGCNQLGCPYPAVCDKTSGVCTINQQQGPGAAAPQAPGAGIIANNPNPGSIIPPVCDVPAPTISQVTSFCANQVAGLGGVTFDPYTQLLPNSNDGSFYASIPSNVNCTQDQKTNHVACSGPPGTSFQVTVCNTCGVIQPQGSVICAFGRTANPPNGCFPSSPQDTHNGQVPVCLPGTHYDNNKQNCVDDVTGKLVSACPSGYPYYNPEFYTCSSKPNQGIFNCQTFTVPLGECVTPVKKIPGTGNQCPAGKTYKCTKNPLTGAQVCSCQ
jgi:hypothetical protein